MVELARRAADEVFIPFTIGGGIRSVADAQAVLDAGADKVSVNSAALQRPELIDELAATFGAQCVVLAIDAKRTRTASGWEAYLAGGRTATGRDAVAWAREGAERGAGEILLTSMDRDGTNAGYDLELTAAVAGAVSVPVIASGGAGELEHLAEALQAGRRRGPVRLDLPLRPAHRGRGQAPARGSAASPSGPRSRGLSTLSRERRAARPRPRRAAARRAQMQFCWGPGLRAGRAQAASST